MSEANFLKQFSKDNHPEERTQKATEIIEARSRAREARERKSDVIAASVEKDKELGETIARLEKLSGDIASSRAKIEEMTDVRFGAIRNFWALKKAREELTQLEEQHAVTTPDVVTLRSLVDAGNAEIATLTNAIADPEHILADFYSKERAAWEHAPVSEQDIREHFSADHLSSLSTKEYVLLLRRFPSEMVTHVSRRGVRDHTGFMYHTTGVDEFHDAFDRMLESGKLRSALATKLETGEAEKIIGQFVQLDRADDRQDAIAMLDTAMGASGFGSIADTAAVHVAAEDVADMFYGAESKNEVFVVYPSALIASEYLFNGSLTDANKDDRTHNDTWIWLKEEEGIPLDAGFVFVPKDTMVDRVTGSRYAVDSNNRPRVAQKRVDDLFALVGREDFGTFILDAARKREKDWAAGFSDKPKLYDTYAVRTALREQFGVTNDGLVKKLEEYGGAELVKTLKAPDADGARAAHAMIEQYLRDENLYFAEAEDAVPAEEFWNAYFSLHPQRKPKHVVMYEGGDPMAALDRWRTENGLTKRGKDVGVDLNRTHEPLQRPGDSVRTVWGGERFRAIVMAEIDKRFPEEEEIPPDV